MDKDNHVQIIESLGSLHARVDKIEETMVTKDEFKETTERLTNTLDNVLTIVQRLDQERVFTMEWVRRIETDMERVKKHLHLA